jgi:hypothetical protein
MMQQVKGDEAMILKGERQALALTSFLHRQIATLDDFKRRKSLQYPLETAYSSSRAITRISGRNKAQKLA